MIDLAIMQMDQWMYCKDVSNQCNEDKWQDL